MILAVYRHLPAERPAAQHLYQMFRDGDFLALLFAAGIVFYAGLVVSARHPKVYQIGKWLGGLSFLAYVAAGISFDGYDPLDCLFAYAVKGGVFAALTIGASRLIATVAIWTWEILMFIPQRLADRRTATRRRAEQEVRRKQEEADRLYVEEQARQQSEQRRRDGEEYQKRSQEVAKRQAIELRRRVDARAECEFYYGKHHNEISYRFDRSMFDAFMKTYMNDSQPPDAVEERGGQLRSIMRKHRKAGTWTKKTYNVQEIADWFLNEKQRIESLPIDEELREEHLVQLNIRYDELTRDVLQSMEP